MAEATFIGRTRLDTKGMREGFARVKQMSAKTAKELNKAGKGPGLGQSFKNFQHSATTAFGAIRAHLKDFNRDVTQNVVKAAGAFSRLVKGAALAGGGLAGIGVAKNFKLEAVESQFAIIMGSAEEASDKVNQLFRRASETAFDPSAYIDAYKTLLTTSDGELATDEMMQGIGDAAAVMGKQIEEVAGQVSYLYAMLKSGKGGGGAAKQMLKDSIITLDTYKYIQKNGKDASKVGDVWKRVTQDLNNFSGGMERMKRTGSGAFAVLRNMASLTLIEAFRGFSEVVKDVVYNFNNFLSKLNSSGRVAVFGMEFSVKMREIADTVYRAIVAFRDMDVAAQKAFKNLIIGAGIVVVAFNSGILVPMLKATAAFSVIVGKMFARLAVYAVANFAAVGKAAGVLAVALAGFNIGNMLYEGFGETGKRVLETVSTILEGIANLLFNFMKVQIAPFVAAIKKLVTDPLNFNIEKDVKKPSQDATDALKADFQQTLKQLDAIWQQTGKPPKDWGEAFNDLPKKFGETFAEMWAKIKDLDFSDLMKLMPDIPGLKEFLDQFKRLEGVRLPSMPKPPDMSKARIDAEAIADANRKANAYTIRGYYFRKLDMAAIIANAKNNGKLAEHNRKRELDAQKKAQSKQTLKPIETEFQRSNRLLEDIKRNTGKNSGAVYT